MEKRRIVHKIISVMLAFVMVAAMMIEPVHADEATVYATSEDGSKKYMSVNDAWNAAKGGTAIIMQADWSVSSTLTVPSSKTVSVNMNGHKIAGNGLSGSVFNMEESSTLKLTADIFTETNFSFSGWEYNNGKKSDNITLQSGGLVTGGNNSSKGGAVTMDEGCSLNLDNVSLAGNYGSYGGGVYSNDENCQIIMKNEARISNNYSKKHGGGVYGNDENLTIRMDNSSICYNYAGDDGKGGGIYSGDRKLVIDMTNGSHIDYNSSEKGGAIYLTYPNFTISSSDASSSISYNRAREDSDTDGRGGAIYTEQTSKKNSGTINGITFDQNSSKNEGGAIYLDQESVTISNCKFTNCSAEGNGGAIYNNNDKNTISSCTITGNTTYGKGGGIYSDSMNDITLSGKMIVKDNKRHNDSVDDDVFLQIGKASTAYIKGTPSGSSEIGIRTDSLQTRVISKDDSFYYKNAYFYDNDKAGSSYSIKVSSISDGKCQLKIESNSSSDTNITRESVHRPDPTTTENGYNDQDLITGYFSYPSVVESTEDLDAKFYYSDGYFLNGSEDADAGDPTAYNEHLATMSMNMAMAGFYSNIGNDGSNDEYDCKYTYKSQNIEKLFTDIGIDSDDIYISETNTLKPSTNSIGFAIGQKKIKNGDASYTLIPIAMRGAGYESEWTSNTTVSTEKNYTGEHAGFAEAADTVFNAVVEYIKNYGLEEEAKEGKIKFWIAGYSRGGAVSNLTAKRLVEAYANGQTEGGSNQVYAYCFEAPQGGVNSAMQLDASKYYCIHNCINKTDLVPLVGPKDMGFMRYGVDHYIPGSTSGSVSENTTTWSFINDQSWASSYKTWYDNQSYTVDASVTNTTDYGKQREKMIAQLNSIDPDNIYFTDYFRLATINYFSYGVSTYVSWLGSDLITETTTSGTKMTQEEFLQIFWRALQAWGLYNGSEADFRTSYATAVSDKGDITATFQEALQNVVQILFSKSNDDLQGMMDAITANAGSIDYKTDVWKECVGTWTDRTVAEREDWTNKLWGSLIDKQPATGNSVASYLTGTEYDNLKSSFNTILDVLLRFIQVDYNTNVKNWGDSTTLENSKRANVMENISESNREYSDTQVVLGTLGYNITAIAESHYPEINLAWVRSYDSFYTTNEANKVYTITTTKTPNVRITQLSNDSSKVVLSADKDGAGIYYCIKGESDADFGDWMPYNDIITLKSEKGKDTTYTIQATAVYCGNVSAVKEETITVGGSYTVTINGEKYGTYQAGKTVKVNGTSTDTSKVFKEWTNAATVGGKEIEITDKANSVISFTMPSENVELTASYAARIKDMTLTVAKPKAGETLASEGTLSWTDDGKEQTCQTQVYWYTGEDGENTPITKGTAEYATTYKVGATIKEDSSLYRYFSSDLTADNIKVVYTDDAAQSAQSASVDSAGTLQLIGPAVTTDKAAIKSIPDAALNVEEDITEEAFKAMLPKNVTVSTDIGDKTVSLDLTNLDLSAIIQDGVVKNSAEIQIPLSTAEDLDTSNLSQKVTVTVDKKPVVAEVVFSGATQEDASTENVKFTCATEGATIYYTINDGEKKLYSADGISLVGEEGCKTSFKVCLWAEKEGYRSSAQTTEVYVIDNPYTISVNGKDTAFKQDGLWDSAKTVKCYKGETAVIVAPTEGGEVFAEWTDVPESSSTDGDVLKIENVSGNATVTAVYNPVVSTIDLTMEEPEVGQRLAAKIKDATVKVENSYSITDYLDEIEWSPEDTKAAYNTTYTARIKFKDGVADMEYIFANNLAINVKNEKGEVLTVKTSLINEDGTDVLYVTFPTTDKVKLTSVKSVDNIGVSRENAAAGNWNIPTETTITLADKTSQKATINWSSQPSFDSSNLEGQTMTLTGTVVLPDYVDAGDASTEVKMTVSIPSAESVETPKASIAEGGYMKEQSVHLSCDTEGAVIYYTLDSSEPTAEETDVCKKYTEGEIIKVLSGELTTTLKMIAVKDGLWTSSAEYTYQKQLPEPTVTPEEGSYPEAQDVTLSCEVDDAIIYYTLDGSDPSEEGNANRLTYAEGDTIKVLDGEDTTTIKAIAVRHGYLASDVAEFVYTKGEAEPTEEPTETPTEEPTKTPTEDSTDVPVSSITPSPTGTPSGSSSIAPSYADNPSNSGSGSQSTSTTKTGDTSNPFMWVIILLICCVAVGGVAIWGTMARKKKHKK